MGRRRRIYVGTQSYLPDSRIPDVRRVNSEQLSMFYFDSAGPVSDNLGDLLVYGSSGDVEVDPVRVQDRLIKLKSSVVSAREDSKERNQQLVVESTGLSVRRAENAYAREAQAQAQAIILAAKAGGVKLSPNDFKTLTPLAQGRYWDAVYGSAGQYEQGTITTRLRAQAGRSRTSDPSARARSEEARERLQEYRNAYTRRADTLDVSYVRQRPEVKTLSLRDLGAKELANVAF